MTPLSPTPPKTTVELPFPPGWSSAKGCSHGKLWDETCDECEIVSLRASLEWMEPRVKRDRARLKQLLGAKA